MTTEEENELICERLLSLTKHCQETDCKDWRTKEGKRFYGTPTFTDWASAGLILEALFAQKGLASVKMRVNLSQLIADIRLPGGKCQFNPLAIRAAALAYLREGK